MPTPPLDSCWPIGRAASSIRTALGSLDHLSPKDRAMIENLESEHRVSDERTRVFLASYGVPRSVSQMERSVVNYLNRSVRSDALGSFLKPQINGANFVVGHGDITRAELPSGFHLAHVFSINRQHRAMAWGKSFGLPRLRDFPQAGGMEEIDAWLDDQIYRRGHDSTEAFIDDLIAAMNGHRIHSPWHPVWVAGWDQFKHVALVGANRWTEVVGVPRDSNGEWLCVLRYEVREVGLLARPTVLEAGWFPWHCPSPKSLAVLRGGLTMDLCTSNSPGTVSEYVHAQMDFKLSHWVEGGRLLGKTSGRVCPNLDACRKRHKEELARMWP